MIPVPKLPAALVAALSTVAFVLGLAEPSLGSPWQEVDAAVLAVLTALGVRSAHVAVSAHGRRTARHAAAAAGDTSGSAA